MPPRGLTNDLFSNNCFLNVITQALAYISGFREGLVVPRPAAGSGSFVQVLKSVIDDLHHDLDYIPVSSKPLRQALAAIDITDRRFALNTKADVDEALYAMLAQIHREHTGGGLDVPCEPQCIAHKTFAFAYVDQRLCEACSALDVVSTGQEFVFRTYVHQIFTTLDSNPMFAFNDALKCLTIPSLDRGCPLSVEGGRCAGPSNTVRMLLAKPKALLMFLQWPDADMLPTAPEIRRMMTLLGQSVDPAALAKSFDEVADGFEYVVQSINCYGCGHYVTYQLVDGRWYLIDDARVEALPSYEAVVDRTSRNLYVPVMCFFEQRPVGSGVARLAPTLDPGTAAVFNVRLHNSTCKSFGVRLCMVDGEVRVRAVLGPSEVLSQLNVGDVLVSWEKDGGPVVQVRDEKCVSDAIDRILSYGEAVTLTLCRRSGCHSVAVPHVPVRHAAASTGGAELPLPCRGHSSETTALAPSLERGGSGFFSPILADSVTVPVKPPHQRVETFNVTLPNKTPLGIQFKPNSSGEVVVNRITGSSDAHSVVQRGDELVSWQKKGGPVTSVTDAGILP